MSKRKITYGETVKQMLREAGANEKLRGELVAVQVALARTTAQAVTALIKLLKTSACHETQWLIGKVLGTIKDPRAMKPLMKAAIAPENERYSCNFLWPLEKYDCTKHLDFFVRFMLEDPGEAIVNCYYIILSIKCPFEVSAVKKNIRKSLSTSSSPIETDTEHLKMSAADHLMATYFTQVARKFHGRNGTKRG